MASEQMPNDDELADLADSAFKAGDTSLDVTLAGLRAVYEAGVAAERERVASMLDDESPFHHYDDTEAHWRIGRLWASIIRKGE